VSFPLYLRLGHIGTDLHMLFETLAYVVGYQLYRRLRQSFGDPLSQDHRWWIIATAAAGAVLGSRILGCLEQAPEIVHQWRNPAYLVSGKSIVGGLVGGWIAVEWIKRRLGITVSTGDLFAAPLAVGIAIGRVGCFLAGLPDQTYGIATTLPWGVDFGDGAPRHPTQLYEMAFLLAFSLALWMFLRQPHRNGDVFKLFIAGYMGWRLLVDFLKPEFRVLGLSIIQWTCLLVSVYCYRETVRILTTVQHGMRNRPEELA
jgi:phosphatidylglycerol---prolipoprotein diacylglyceryl transferase